jgi:transcriptional regulator with XRE-family HTH domain
MARLQLSQAFGLIIRNHRKKQNLSQEGLAEKADIHPTHVGLIERGGRNPTINIAASLARALGQKLPELK